MRVLRLRAAPRFAQDDTFLGRGGGRTGNGNCNGEMRGSLHCATDGETVCCFGRDDALFCFWRYRTRSNRGFLRCAAEMTNKKTGNCNGRLLAGGVFAFTGTHSAIFSRSFSPAGASKGVPLAVAILLKRRTFRDAGG